MANIEQNQEHKLENILNNQSSSVEETESEEAQEQTPQNRYYNNSSQEVCLKCEKTGHTENNCNEQICVICLKPHQRQDCANIFKCFTCGDKSHSQQDCPNKDQNRCYKCHKVGHSGKQCGYLVLSQEYVFNKIMCIKCPSEGHNNCHIKNWYSEQLVLNDKLFQNQDSLQQKALERIRDFESNFYQAQASSYEGYHLRRYSPDPLPYYQTLVQQNSDNLKSDFEDYKLYDDYITEEPEGEEEFTDFKKVLKNQIQGQSKRLAQNTIKKKEAMQKNFQKQIFQNPISQISMVPQQQFNESSSSNYMFQNQQQYKKSKKINNNFNNPNSSSYYYYNNQENPEKEMFLMNQNNQQGNYNNYQNPMMMNPQQINQQMFQISQNFQNQNYKQRNNNGRKGNPKSRQNNYAPPYQQGRNMMAAVGQDYQQNQQQQFNFQNNFNTKNQYQNLQQNQQQFNSTFQSYSNKNYQKNQQKYKKNYKKNKKKSQFVQFYLFITFFKFLLIIFCFSEIINKLQKFIILQNHQFIQVDNDGFLNQPVVKLQQNLIF